MYLNDYLRYGKDNELRNRDRLPYAVRLEGCVLSPEGRKVTSFAALVFLKAGAETRLTQTVSVDSPVLWSAETPSLYRCEVQLTADGMELGTAGVAVRLEAAAESVGEELVYAGLTLRAENGSVTEAEDVELRVSVSGAGELAGLAGGDPKPTHGFTGNVTRSFHGRALAILHRTGGGEITLTAVSDTGLNANVTVK